MVVVTVVLLTTLFTPLLFTLLVSDLVPDRFATLALPRTDVFRVVLP